MPTHLNIPSEEGVKNKLTKLIITNVIPTITIERILK